MREELKLFVLDVFDAETDVNEFIDEDVEKATRNLNITRMFKDARIQQQVVFRKTWKTLFHIYPSFHLTNLYFSAHATVAANEMNQYAAKTLPHFRFLGMRPEHFAQAIEAHHKSTKENHDAIKEHIEDKLKRRYGEEASFKSTNTYGLYTQLRKGYASKSQAFLQSNGLDSSEYDLRVLNPLTGRKRPTSDRALQSTVFDAVAHTATVDSHMFLAIAGSVIVQVDDVSVPKDTIAYVANAVAHLGNKVVLVANTVQHFPRTDKHNLMCVHRLNGLDASETIPPIAAGHVYVGASTSVTALCAPGKGSGVLCFKPSELPCVDNNSCGTSSAFLEKWLNNRTTKKTPEVEFLSSLHNAMPWVIDNALPADARTASNAVVFLDNRPNITTALAVRVTLACLKKGAWGVVGFVHREDEAFYRRWLGENAVLITDNNFVLAKQGFSLEYYNAILKDVRFWEQLEGFHRVLFVQDDGFIVRPGLEDMFMEYDYVGAPWAKDMPYNSYLVASPEGALVGNGGLSLRNPKKMKEICELEPTNVLHFDGLQVEPEDVFFAKACVRRGFKVPTYDEAQRFSTEEVMCKSSFGFHKLWGYHPKDAVQDFFNGALAHIKNIVWEH